VPLEFRVYQNYPNPFNPGTTVTFDLPHRSRVIVSIYSILGQEVATISDSRRDAGTYEVTWNGRSSHGVPAAAGIYICRVASDGASRSIKMILAR
jgi:flagellar hook assembly protein FlgD